jgi:hypothetical protein
MSQIRKGHTYGASSPDNQVTHTNLNAHVDDAILLPGAITEQTPLTTTASDDQVLVSDTDAAWALKKVTLANLLPDGNVTAAKSAEANRQSVHQYAAGALTAGVYAVTLSPAATAYTTGMVVRFKASAANTGAVNIDVNSLGQKDLFTRAGGELAANDILANAIVTCVYDGGQFQVLEVLATGAITGPQLAASAAAVIGSSRNLVIAYLSPHVVTVDADEVLLKDASNKPFLGTSLSIQMDIENGVFLNGLETGGTESASHWYYLWLIGNGTLVRSVLEDAGADPAAAPAGPDLSGGGFAGYTYKALIGAIRNDGSSNFVQFLQHDRTVWVNDTVLFVDKGAAVADTYESYQAGGGGSDVDLRTLIPPNAKRLRGSLGYTSTTGTGEGMAIAADGNGLGAVLSHGSKSGNGTPFVGYNQASSFEIPLKEAQKFYWKAINNSASQRGVNVSGYTI